MAPMVVDVVEYALCRGISLDVKQFPQGTHTAEQAAAALEVEVGQIVKSLVFAVDGEIVMALMSGDNRLQESLLASSHGGKSAGRVSARIAKEVTGYSIGGVPPFGHLRELPTYVDQQLFRFEVVWASAGSPYEVFGVEPQVLTALADGKVSRLHVERCS